MKAVKKQKSKNVIQLKITLMGSKPEIWRRLIVPEDSTLEYLHALIQISMGWQNSHLHQFEINEKRYSDPEFELDLDGSKIMDTQKTKLSEIIKSTKKFMYEYDFGDGWRHEITIESTQPQDPRALYPACVGGERACPPEDCGGMGGYYNLLDQLKNPKNPDHEQMMTWIGGFFDPNGFDPNRINRDYFWSDH